MGTTGGGSREFGHGGNPPLVDVAAAFATVPGRGKVCGADRPLVDSDPIGHYQGMGVYRDRWVVLTHSTRLWDAGWFTVWDSASGGVTVHPIPTPDGMKHPGGLQVIGDYLVLGVEPTAEDALPSLVCFYDLRDIERGGPKPLPRPRITSAWRSAAAVGIARLGDRHVLAVHGSDPCGKTYFYWSDGRPLGDPDLTFDTEEPILGFRAEVNGKRTGYDNLALLTSTAGELFMVGLRGDTNPRLHTDDHADLWRIDVDPRGPKAELVATREFTTEGWGPLLPHFRFGAGAAATGDSALEIFCSSRSAFVGLEMNVFTDGPVWSSDQLAEQERGQR
ncbi:hypothetical protein JOD54_004947 [Actinokineospora baliensis]|uniref:hypothetical protein n=1 Tax=Actinokineospora baliensis TaxID=547056 RepID=UPI0019566B35|nr:hypothetical protein [Actinokineospora baliensis]MBM7774743.1 hypothetical protein [Actinokineospora baliensis]